MLSLKIRLGLFFLFLCFATVGHAQTPANTLGDSTQIKLDEYKKLYDSGVIGEDEYNKMKGELQVTSKPAPAPAATSTPQSKPVDSTQVKLDQLKKLLDTGVISQDEFAKSRAKILGLPEPEIKQDVKSDVVLTKADTMPLNALRDRAKSKTIAGAVILSVGGAFIIGDILFATLSPKLNSKDSLYSDKLATRRGSEIALGVLGGVAGIGGALFVALGLKDRALYRRRNKELTMNFTGKEFEIAFVF